MRAVPTAPADMKPNAILRQIPQRVIECLDAHAFVFLELIKWRFRIDHIPVVREARIIDLKHEAGVDDRLVFHMHRLCRRKKKFFLSLVVEIFTARETTWSDRAHKTFLEPARGKRSLQI